MKHLKDVEHTFGTCTKTYLLPTMDATQSSSVGRCGEATVTDRAIGELRPLVAGGTSRSTGEWREGEGVERAGELMRDWATE